MSVREISQYHSPSLQKLQRGCCQRGVGRRVVKAGVSASASREGVSDVAKRQAAGGTYALYSARYFARSSSRYERVQRKYAPSTGTIQARLVGHEISFKLLLTVRGPRSGRKIVGIPLYTRAPRYGQPCFRDTAPKFDRVPARRVVGDPSSRFGMKIGADAPVVSSPPGL